MKEVRVSCVLIDSQEKVMEKFGSKWFGYNVKEALKEKGVEWRGAFKCVKVEENKITIFKSKGVKLKGEDKAEKEEEVKVGVKEEVEYDLLVWSTGASAPPLLSTIPLAKDKKGFLEVNSFLHSPNDESVYGGGDCICISSSPNLPKAGVYAVREANTLSHNLLLHLRQESKEEKEGGGGGVVGKMEYSPQSSFLSLLMTGDKRAISNYHFTSFHNSLMWLLKDYIDQTFMSAFLPPNESEKRSK